MANWLSELRPPVAVARQLSGRVYSCPLPTCWITSWAGNTLGSAKPGPPAPVWARSRCFIDTVSPARSRVRSNTVWATRSGRASRLVGTLKRQASMPFCQLDQVKAMSAAPSLLARALTK